MTWRKPAAPDPRHRPVDLAADVGAAVLAQDVVVEMLDAQAQAGDADVGDGGHLGLGQGARLALEGDLVGLAPGHGRLGAGGQGAQVAGADVGGGAAAEVDELQGPAGDPGAPGIGLDLAAKGVEVAPDLAGVAVHVDAEVAELAALPAEGDVQVEPEVRGPAAGGGLQHRLGGGDLVGAPEGVRRVVGDEDAAHVGVGEHPVQARGGRLGPGSGGGGGRGHSVSMGAAAKQWSTPSVSPITSRPEATAGEAAKAEAPSKVHISAPVARSSPCRTPRMDAA